MHDWPSDDASEVPSPRLVAAWLVLDTLPTERVPLWAAYWLAGGSDGDALARLAGLSGDDPHDVRDLLPDALVECGVWSTDLLRSGGGPEIAAAMVAFTALAKLQVSGRASERWVVSKVYELVEPEFDQAITQLPLGWLFSLDDEWGAGWGRTEDQLRAAVRKACGEQIDAAYGPDRPAP
jgi:hypothetical protein